jgi:hypothetical protein
MFRCAKESEQLLSEPIKRKNFRCRKADPEEYARQVAQP